MPIYTTNGYTQAGLAPSPSDLLDWDASLWQTTNVLVTSSVIRATRDDRSLFLYGEFFESASGLWFGTVQSVEIRLFQGSPPGPIGRATLTGLSIPLSDYVSVFGGAAPPQFNPLLGNYLGFIATTLDGADSMTGGTGSDSLIGYGGNDTINAAGGRDSVFGAGGDDLLLVNAGDVTAGEAYDGGAGFDTLRVTWNGSTSPDFRGSTLSNIEVLDLVGAGWQRVTLAGSAVGGTTGFQQIRANGSFREIVIHGAVDASALTFDNRDFFSITLVGTAAAEQLRMASTGPPLGLNIIRPGSGADTIVGGNGNEFLYLSEGDLPESGPRKQISLGGGLDVIIIEAGSVNLRDQTVTPDFERLDFSADAISLSLNANQASFGPGFRINTNASIPVNILVHQAQNLDLSQIAFSANWVAQQRGRFDITGTAGNDSIIGSAGVDIIRTLGGSDTIRAGGGDDAIIHEPMDPTLIPTTLTRIDGGDGRDSLSVLGTMSAVLNRVEEVIFSLPTSGQIAPLTRLAVLLPDAPAQADFTLDRVTGQPGAQSLEFDMNPSETGTIDLSGITFSNWNAAEDRVLIDVDFDTGTVVGSQVADTVTVYAAGRNVDFSLGDGDDSVRLAELPTAYTGRFEGGAGVDTLEIVWEMLSSPGVIDFTAATTLGIERLEIADVMGAIIPGHFFGPGRVTTVESIPYSTELTGRLPVTIVGQSMSLYATWEGAARPIATHVRGTDQGDLVELGSLEVTDVRLGLGDDTVIGGNLRDLVWGGAGNDRLGGWLLSDTLLGEDGNDTLEGESGDDLLYGWTGRDLLWGGIGNDMLHGEQDDDALLGDSGDDVGFGGDGADILYGWLGRDLLWGGDGNDTIWGEQDNDTLLGETGDDVLLGIDGDDVMYGWTGNDTLYGWVGDDVLWGEAGNDSLLGEDGNDTFIGGLGRDTMTGGAGADRFFNANFEIAAGEVDLITDFDVNDRYLFQAGASIQYFNFNAPGYGAGAGIHVSLPGGVFILDVFGATAAQLQAQTQFF